MKSSPDTSDDEYDPHQQRVLENPINTWETYIHLIKCALGTGILAMPQGFAKVGMVGGVLGNIIGGIIVAHCLHLIVRSQYLQCKRKHVPLLSYSEALQVAIEHGPTNVRRLGRLAGIVVDVLIITTQLGVCSIYIIYIAQSLKQLVDPSIVWSMNIHMSIVLVPVMILNLIPNLKFLAPFSAVANVMILLGLAAIVYFSFTAERPDDSPIKAYGPFVQIPLFFGMVLFALTATGAIIAVELNMKEPMKFRGKFGIFNLVMATLVFIYILLGIIGYTFCRNACADSITLNIPQDNWLAKLVVAAYGVAVLITYALHCYVPVQILFNSIKLRCKPGTSTKRLILYNYILRIGLCLFTFTFAIAVPRVGIFISLFGALCLPTLGMFFPAIMEALDTRSVRTWVKDFCLVIIGLLAMFTGCYTSIKTIVESFKE